MQHEIVEFELNDIFAIGMVFVVAGVALSYGTNIIEGVSEDTCAYNFNKNGCFSCPVSFPTFNITDNTCRNASLHSVAGTNNGSVAFNATNDAIEGVTKIPAKLPTIINVVIAALIIGLLVRFLWVRYNG